MKPRRHPVPLSGVYAHPWYCVRCRRYYPEPQMRRRREVGVDLFACPVCRYDVGARFLF